MNEKTAAELRKLINLIDENKRGGVPTTHDVAIHATMLVRNGWPAQEALDESERTLDDAEIEGGY